MMRPQYSNWRRAAAFAVFAGAAALHVIAAVQPVSRSHVALSPPAGGGGDADFPVMSPDGRYVVFASTANNLVLNSNNVPIPTLSLPVLNVYRRDRITGISALVSVNLAGTGGGNGDSLPQAVSTNGQYVLFESAASDLVADDTNDLNDIFVRDLVGGTTFLVSVNTNGASGNGASRNPVMTPDGRYVAFVSSASDLASGDTNQIPDIFVRDLQLDTTTLASFGAVSTNSNPSTASMSDSPAITPDGRYVAFFSTATNLVPGVRLAGEVYVRDVVGGNTDWASTAARPLSQILLGSTNVVSYQPAISDDGQFVAFQVSSNRPPGASARGLLLRYNRSSGLTDLVDSNANVPYQTFESIHHLEMTPDGRFIAFVGNADGSSGSTTAIYRWDALSYSTDLASPTVDGNVSTNSTCLWPAISDDGRYVLFVSSATNLTGNPLNGDYHIYLRDLVNDVTALVDVDTNGIGTGVSPGAVPALSADGRLVAFEAADGELVPDDSNHRDDVFVRDLIVPADELVSARDPGLPSLAPSGDSAASPLSVSQDGRLVAFASEGDNVANHDHNGLRDVFVRDLMTGSNILVSVDSNGVNAADGVSTDPSISGDGRYVAFASSADNLVDGDTNRVLDVFVRDLQLGLTIPVSRSADGATLGNADSSSPVISANGRFVLFHSRAQNLAAGSFGSGVENLFLRDLQAGTNYALTQATFGTGVSSASMTPDGRFTAFLGRIGGTGTQLYVWDSQAATITFTNTPVSPLLVSISPDGQWLAYLSIAGITLVSVPANTNVALEISTTIPFRPGLRFSADGRFLAYAFTNRVYLYDTSTGSSLLLSQGVGLAGEANGNSDSPDISADGRFVVYRSAATNLVAGDANGVPDLFVYDRLTGATSLLTLNTAGDGPADNRSLGPTFSGDGRMIFFRSWASDLAANDFNQSGDAFGYAFLYLTITATVAPGEGPTISWPVAPGQSYQVQYKDNLSDADWQEVGGTIEIVGNRGYLTDPTPAAGQRFYQVVAN